jgi:HSP20 family protein
MAKQATNKDAPAMMPFTARLDVYEKDNALVYKAELPGMRKEDVKVEIDADHLLITGEAKAQQKAEDHGYYRAERHYGSFYRRVPLPVGVDLEQISAKLSDGVLEVTIPRPADTKSAAKQVPIT